MHQYFQKYNSWVQNKNLVMAADLFFLFSFHLNFIKFVRKDLSANQKEMKTRMGAKKFITIIQSLQKSSFLKASLNIFIMLFAMNVKVAQSARSAPSAQCCPVSRAAPLRPAAPFLFQLKKNLLNDLKQLFVRFIFRQ